MKKRDEKRFKVADANDDGQLDEEELALFTHPEESARMTNVIVQVITLNLNFKFEAPFRSGITLKQ